MNIREEISKLSIDGKIQLAMDIWDSIADESKPDLTEEQKQMLDDRLEEIESGKAKFYTWEEVKEKLTERIKETRKSKENSGK